MEANVSVAQNASDAYRPKQTKYKERLRAEARKTAFQSLIAAGEETRAKIQSKKNAQAAIAWLDVCAENFKGVDAAIDDGLTKRAPPKPLGRRRQTSRA